jgi:hypothetical protein
MVSMIPSSFTESNTFLDKPVGFFEDQCVPLAVFKDNRQDKLPVVISCWKMTREELEEIIRTGRIWLVVCGETMPPVMLSGLKADVFTGDDK